MNASSILLCAALAALLTPLPASAREFTPVPDTLVFTPTDSLNIETSRPPDVWMRTGIGDGLLMDHDQWRWESERHHSQFYLHGDYNRVDRLRYEAGYRFRVRDRMAPRLGVRIGYADGRDKGVYGFQIEQPIIPPGRIAIGASMVRRTDHHELHQVPDGENSVSLVLARFDYRDYWEREGMGAYVSWRVPDFSKISVHLRRDDYRTLVSHGATSWFNQDRDLPPNPAIDDGEAHTVALRLERSARTTPTTRTGTYHWVEVEWAGRGLEGDFTYTRLLADVRGVVRLTPATTLMLRGVAGHTASGTLPSQKRFPLGGMDGLRAHGSSQYHGEQLMLLQAEYVIGLWKLRTGAFDGGIHAIAFLDAGAAWTDPEHNYSIGDHKIELDGGLGVAAAEDKLRVYFAKDLHRTDSPFVARVRLQRPF
jgi:hypothetical protein